ncbi:hypothetical protein [Amycolatopsis sp. Poz14]|uniref:hypothetical protein n=1 Tax=Amycolatopsis sp. Poz14 TaxID=1447705 RepID=UPI001EE8A7CC|nr:hypothetical protein [Amycolatopsis sp. Poz14]
MTLRTRQALVRIRAVLLAGTVLALVTSYLAVSGVVRTADQISSATSRAILEVAAARDALVSADAAAIASFASGEAKLAGPGQEYENRMASASQSLARVAEFNQAGEPGTGTLQTVEGLVASYSGAMGQADAHFRQPGGELVGLADLWYASLLLHGPDNVLDLLGKLQKDERAALDTQISGTRMSAGPLILWLLPPLVLLALLVSTQVFLRQRFRRRLNLPLLGATALGLGVVAGLLLAAALAGRLDTVRSSVDEAVAVREKSIEAADADGHARLAALLYRRCGPPGCGSTVDDFRRRTLSASTTAPAQNAITSAARAVTSAGTAATESGGLPVLVPAALILAGALTVVGLYRRIDEYRYRP